jgi:hypothetical protein
MAANGPSAEIIRFEAGLDIRFALINAIDTHNFFIVLL